MILKELCVSVFVNTQDRNDDKALVKLLFNEFFDTGYLVTNFVLNNFSINSANGGSPIAQKILRPQLVNASSGESIVMLPDRIDYRVNPIIDNGIIKWPELSQIQNGTESLIKLLNMINKKVSRIALNTQYMIETSVIQNDSTNLFMKEKDLVETNERYVTREIYENETINVIIESVQNIELFKFSIDGVNYENRIKLILTDINTHQSNSKERFAPDELGKFIQKFKLINDSLISGE